MTTKMTDVQFNATIKHPTKGEIILFADIPVEQCDEHDMGQTDMPHVWYDTSPKEGRGTVLVCIPEDPS